MDHLRIEIKWAIIYSVFAMLWSLAERLTGLHDKYLDLQQNLAMLILVPTVLIYVLEMLDKKKNFYGKSMSYVQGFMSGIMLTVFIMVLTPVVQLITFYIISPHYFSNLVDYSVAQGVFTKEQAQKEFNYGNFVFISVVFSMITGVVYAAFIALFVKTDTAKDNF